MTWYPPTTPFVTDSSIPFFTAGMYSFGIAPPTILFSIVTPFPAFARLDFHYHMTVLTAAAGLLDQLPFARGVFGNRLAISDLRFARIRIDLELPQHAVPDNLQMQLAHPGDNRLPGVFVGEDPESRIFF